MMSFEISCVCLSFDCLVKLGLGDVDLSKLILVVWFWCAGLGVFCLCVFDGFVVTVVFVGRCVGCFFCTFVISREFGCVC